MKFIHVTDLHLCPLNKMPQSRSESFHLDIQNKFRWVEDYIRDNSISFVILSGDIFHIKAGSEYTPESLNYYSGLFEDWKVPIYTIPGNHDLQKSSIHNIEKSAYKAIVKSTDNMVDVSYNIDSFNRPNGAEGMVHLPEHNITISGIPYFPLVETMGHLKNINEEFSKRPDSYRICLLHTDAIPNNDIPLHWATASYEDLFERSGNIDLICQGHIHLQFPLATQGRTTISKPWAFSRVSKDYHNKTEILEHLHMPAITVVTRETGQNTTYQYIPIKCVSFDIAFKKDSIKKQLEVQGVTRTFIDKLKKDFGSASNAFSLSTPENLLEQVSVPDEVREVINQYLPI